MNIFLKNHLYVILCSNWEILLQHVSPTVPKKEISTFLFVNTYIFTINIIIFIINLLNLKPSIRVIYFLESFIYFLDALQTDMVNYESPPHRLIVKHLDAKK